MNNIIPFNYQSQEVRTILKDGEPWFIAKDVCDVLDIINSRDVVNRLDEDEKDVVLIYTLGGDQSLQAVNEPGLYSLILGSRKPEAKAFKRWITHEVIPSIRKHGAYLTPQKIEEVLLNPDTIIQLATRLKQEREEKKLLQQQIQTDRPFTNFGKSVAHSSDSVTIGEFAKVCNNNSIKIGRNRLFDWLRDNGFLIKQGREKNNPKQRFVEQGLFELKEAVIHTVTDDLIRTTTLITGKGQMYFLSRLEHMKAS